MKRTNNQNLTNLHYYLPPWHTNIDAKTTIVYMGFRIFTVASGKRWDIAAKQTMDASIHFLTIRQSNIQLYITIEDEIQSLYLSYVS
jgi:hypothetical protein